MYQPNDLYQRYKERILDDSEFSVYEATGFRRKLYILGRGVSRRDLAFSKRSAYRLIRPLVLIALRIISAPIEELCYRKEKKAEHDMFSGYSLGIALKKI